MDARHLSQRLATVAAFVPDNARLADIGSDHAYLPANLLLTGRISYAVAGEVVSGPYHNMVREIKRYGLEGRLIPRLANGCMAIKPSDRIDTVTIAGMGGTMIEQILTAGEKRLVGVQTMILEPNVGAMRVRQWLANHEWVIEDEKVLAEDGHAYQVIAARRAKEPVQYNERELRFGPELLKDRTNPAFVKIWQGEADRLRQSIHSMQQAKVPPREKIADFHRQLSEIEEVLR